MEDRIRELGLELPPTPPAGGIYHAVVVTGNLLFVSGQGPVRSDGSLIVGRLGEDMDVEAGIAAARQTGLTMLATIKAHFGELNQISHLVKTLGMVNCTPDFAKQPQVMNGFSQLFVDLLGEQNGRGARSAVGMMLPGNIAVETEAIFELK